jgi:hypothetical protein
MYPLQLIKRNRSASFCELPFTLDVWKKVTNILKVAKEWSGLSVNIVLTIG